MMESEARYTWWQKLALYALLIFVAIIIAYPFYQAVVTSLATSGEVQNYPPRLFPASIQLQNYIDALEIAPLPRYLFNSIVQASLVTLSHLILASLAGYAFAFIDFKFKNFFFLIFLATMMIPWEATIIPNFLAITGRNPMPFCSDNDLFVSILQFIKGTNIVNFTVDPAKLSCTFTFKDTYLGLALPYMATAFGTFLVRQFFMSIPKDLHDAATIDGCSRLRFLTTIAVPLARPALGTLAVYSFLQTYNQYLWPLLVTNDKNMRTVQIGLRMLQDQENLQYQLVMAGVVIILIPTFALFILGNRQLIRGLTAGAVKG
jgi:ABC-type glycerol-3-phosphate transport system permease component